MPRKGVSQCLGKVYSVPRKGVSQCLGRGVSFQLKPFISSSTYFLQYSGKTGGK